MKNRWIVAVLVAIIVVAFLVVVLSAPDDETVTVNERSSPAALATETSGPDREPAGNVADAQPADAPNSGLPKTDVPLPVPPSPPPILVKHGIEGGFLFCEGRFVPPPYEITIKDYAVLVNAKYVIDRVPPPRKPMVGLPADPGEFEWTAEKKKQQLGATGFPEHASGKLEYWGAVHGFDKAWPMFVEYYKSQPGVKSVEVYGPGKLYVRDRQGDGFGTGFRGGKEAFEASLRDEYTATENQALARYREAASEAEELLRKAADGAAASLGNGAVILLLRQDGGASCRMPASRTPSFLKDIGAVLTADVPDEEKLAGLKKRLDPAFAEQVLRNHGGTWPTVGGPNRTRKQ